MFEDVGQVYGAYTLEQKQEIKNINGTGYVLRHNKTGARVAVISNEDENKVFNIGFRTPPKDDTGVAHITEHSVLCGSKKFPVKDPFVELVKGSLNTFLNAMTFPDKTVYPVASCNDKDFQNLMDVYLDAVFHTNIYSRPEILMQEGWHYECEGLDEPIRYNGVVYNEMKGVFSSAEAKLSRLNMKTLYPDTPYSYESGGDPEAIPDLTYEEFLDFHRTYYHPSNSYIYLYGNMDMEEKLRFIDEEYLCHYDELKVDSAIARQEAFAEPVFIEDTYAVTEDEDISEKTYLSYNLSVGESVDARLMLAMQVLEYVLLSVPGAPLKRALVDSGIGKDVYSSFESSIAQPMFSIIAINAQAEQKEEFVKVIRDTLDKLAAEGIDKKSLKAAINIFEFQYREANFGQYPKGLMYGLKILDSWLYDDERVFEPLVLEEIFEWLKAQVDKGYFEELIIKYLLENTHASRVVLSPEKNLTVRIEEEIRKKLLDYKNSMSDSEINAVIENTRHLKEYQDSEDSEEDLKKIPLLKISDIDKKVRVYDNTKQMIAGIPVVSHNIFTNGITYLNFHFDMRNIPLELVPVSSVLVNIFKEVDTENYSYNELTSEINLHTGGIGVSTSAVRMPVKTKDFVAAFEVRVKALHNEVENAVELVREMLFTSNLRDEKRLKEILTEQKISLRQQIMSAGHTAMANRALSYFEPMAKYKEMTDLFDYYEYLLDACANFEERKDTIMEQLEKVRSYILTGNHLTISVTTDQKVKPLLEKPIAQFKESLFDDYTALAPDIILTKGNEGFKTSSQVQYVACAGDYSDCGEEYSGALSVLKMIFSYDYLWMNIRVKGGAYGCGCNILRGGIGYFTSYRDPNLEATYEVYKNAAEYVRNFSVDERTMTKYIIGTISNMDTPLTPSAYGETAFTCYLTGMTEQMRQRDRDDVLTATVEKIRSLAPIVEAVYNSNAFSALGGEDKIMAAKGYFDKIVPLV